MNISNLSNIEKSKLLLEMTLLFMLLITVGVISNPEPLTWLFVNPDNYLETEGRIISSKVGTRGIWGAWRFEITYKYRVGNQNLTSERIHFGYQALSDISYAQGYVDNYFIGKKVVVFYDPRDPTRAVLEPNVRWYGALYFYALVLLVPIILFGLSIKFYRTSR